MVAAVAGLFFTAAYSIPRNTGNRRYLKGGNLCADSKLYLELQLWLWAWPWRQRLRRKSKSASAFNQTVPTAITTMLLTTARPMDFTGRATFTTASSWAWVRGPVGAMATAGVIIASVMAAAEALAAAAAPWPIAAVLRAAAGAEQHAVA